MAGFCAALSAPRALARGARWGLPVSTVELAARIAEPLRLRRWFAAAVLFAAGFFAVVVVTAVTIDVVPTHPIEGPPFLVGGLSDVLRIFSNNFLVLTLYAMVGVAVIVLRRADAHGGGRHHRAVVRAAGMLVAAIVLVAAIRQAYVLGRMLAEYSGYLGESPIRMGLALVPHAAVELSAMFLPLGAILVERRSSEEVMRRALAVAVAIAVPLLMLAAATEVYVSPSVMRAVNCGAPSANIPSCRANG